MLAIGLLFALPGLLAAQAPLRVAIVGLEHGHVEGFLHSLPQHNNVQLVGIADADPALFAKYRTRFGLAESLYFKSMANMIETRRPQAVLVYTSVGEHRHAIEIAAQYGVSVMVEKPLTISLEDALAIRRIARHYHIHVLVNYETTWYASNRAAYSELEHGALGQLRRVVVHDGHQGPKEIGVPPEFLSWLTDPAQNGAGALYDFGCYGGRQSRQAGDLSQRGRRRHHRADLSACAGRDSGVVELALQPQGYGGLRLDRLRHHCWRGQAAHSP
jgi:predicted dehydrogenase